MRINQVKRQNQSLLQIGIQIHFSTVLLYKRIPPEVKK
ncbi:unnamed protein product [Trichobilharzia regenti]|nr:unnamed protein product [Trichobilharzia regenti]